MISDPFILRAILAGLGIAALSGILGCFIVWRRMAYFGDSLAHSALLGVAISLLIGININLSIFIICCLFAILIFSCQKSQSLSIDTFLGIIAHGMLALGIILFSFSPNTTLDIHSYLFGDILTIQKKEIIGIYITLIISILLMKKYWSSMLFLTLQEDIAKAEGIKTTQSYLILILLSTIFAAFAVHIVGTLLLTSLLIIPAATARKIATSPKSMAFFAIIIGIFDVLGGIISSLYFDIPSGPAITFFAAFNFFLISLFVKLKST